ncbi:hypothetical protein [Spirosoma linguale]|uniref:Uncharacterized protein n=1 Tax=Spirosoma linguale (strain ATCC 33905 / DSM 74 / LMG 10896 / Claus 1) TaxID=504472 RepID=D2QEV5_SPILD|nr:hypothetical protein Slin_3288 [Spirosoma linguale DSM 74]ADB41299.1 hypothetical protein Slin_5330 [Spirosoma linguale DSM 74]
MKTTATITGPDGQPVMLTFAQNAIKSYCALLNCEPTIESVLAHFNGSQQIEATCEIIRAGWEQTLHDTGIFVSVSDHKACELMETGTAEEGMNVNKAFFSAILNQNFDQWLKQQKRTSNYTLVNASFFGELPYN